MTNFRVHPTAEVSDQANIGDGASIWHQAQVRERASIGAGCVIASPMSIPGGSPRSRRGRGRRRSIRQASTRKALTWPNLIPSATGCSQSIGAASAARISGSAAPRRWIKPYPAYQTIPTFAATWASSHTHAATRNGMSANGIANTAANGG